MSLSNSKQLNDLRSIISTYWMLPEIFRSPYISGSFVERALAHARAGETLATYDFIDVLSDNRKTGFQVKSTKSTTVITWMRAKIPNKQALIENSQSIDPESRARGLQSLGNAIINFANNKIVRSFSKYPSVDFINYSRIKHTSGTVEYVEAPLCTRANMQLFRAEDFRWEWRQDRQLELEISRSITTDPLEASGVEVEVRADASNEVITSLQGIYIPTGQVWWAWHGKSDNQLHFPGESEWLDLIFSSGKTDRSRHSFLLTLPSNSISLEETVKIINNYTS